MTVPAALRRTNDLVGPSAAGLAGLEAQARRSRRSDRRGRTARPATPRRRRAGGRPRPAPSGARRAPAGRPRAKTSPPFMSIVPEPTSRPSSRRSGWWSSWPITAEVADQQDAPRARPSEAQQEVRRVVGRQQGGARPTPRRAPGRRRPRRPPPPPRVARRRRHRHEAPPARARRARRWRRRVGRSSPASPGRREAFLRRLPADEGDDLVGVVARADQVQVARADAALVPQAAGQPLEQATQNSRPTRITGKWRTLRLDEDERLEELVERPEAAGQTTKADA